MPEGDTIYRTAQVLRRSLLGSRVEAARGRPGGARLERLVGASVAGVTSRGKHLLIDFDVGLTLHSHLGMEGSWHRYRPGERWRRRPGAAVAVLETPTTVAVCFDAPTIELVETRALPMHPALAGLGPDILDEPFDIHEAARRLGSVQRGRMTIAAALLDQTAVAGIGNVYRSEILFMVGLDPFLSPGALSYETIESLLRTAASLLRANTGGGARSTIPSAGAFVRGAMRDQRFDRLWVYRRSGRPCRRCGAIIRSRALGTPPRRLYWCPTCQVPEQSIATVVLASAAADID